MSDVKFRFSLNTGETVELSEEGLEELYLLLDEHFEYEEYEMIAELDRDTIH